VSSGAITSTVAFRSGVGMQSKGDDLGDAARISRATSSVSTWHREYICTRLGCSDGGFNIEDVVDKRAATSSATRRSLPEKKLEKSEHSRRACPGVDSSRRSSVCSSSRTTRHLSGFLVGASCHKPILKKGFSETVNLWVSLATGGTICHSVGLSMRPSPSPSQTPASIYASCQLREVTAIWQIAYTGSHRS